MPGYHSQGANLGIESLVSNTARGQGTDLGGDPLVSNAARDQRRVITARELI